MSPLAPATCLELLLWVGPWVETYTETTKKQGSNDCQLLGKSGVKRPRQVLLLLRRSGF